MAFIITFFLLFLLPGQSYMTNKIYSLQTLCPLRRVFAYVDYVFYTKDSATVFLSHKMYAMLIDHEWENWDNATDKHFLHCEFNVVEHNNKKVPRASRGIYAAVRELNFRRSTAGECIDYIIFEMNTFPAPTSRKICATVKGNEIDEKNYFEIPHGLLKVIIHIGPKYPKANKIVMKLGFTAFDDCSQSYKFRCTNSRCISEKLFNDTIINCIPPDCADEPSFHSRCDTKSWYAIIVKYKAVIGIFCVAALVIFFVVCCVFTLIFRNRRVAPINDQDHAVEIHRLVPRVDNVDRFEHNEESEL